MEPDQDLIEAADGNFIGSYRKLVEHSPRAEMREFGGVFAFVTGLPIGIFNGCIVTGPALVDDLAHALAWIAGHNVPYRLWIHEELTGQLANVALEQAMERDSWLEPQMVLRAMPSAPAPLPGVRVRTVADARLLEVYRAVFVAGGMSVDDAHRLFSDSFAAENDVQLIVAYLDDEPVGTSLALRTGDVGGVYAVGTLPGARRRGVGTAATWAAVAACRAWGCGTIVLQSSEMGFPVYRAMGFRTVVRYAVFRPTR
jgi:GNAT superfamily N-acetyltransferase